MAQQFPCPPALTPCSVGQAAAAVIGYNDQRVVSLDALGCLQSGVAPPGGGGITQVSSIDNTINGVVIGNTLNLSINPSNVISQIVATALLINVTDAFGVFQFRGFP